MPDGGGKGSGGGIGGAGFGQPGTRVISYESMETEARLPWQTTRMAMFVSALLYVALTAILLIVGRWWLTVVGLAFAVWLGASLRFNGHPWHGAIWSMFMAAVAMVVLPEFKPPAFWLDGQALVKAVIYWLPLGAVVLVFVVAMFLAFWKGRNWVASAIIAGLFLCFIYVALPHILKGLPRERIAIHPLYAWLISGWSVIGILWITGVPLLAGWFAYVSATVDKQGPTPPRAATTYMGVIWPWMAYQLWREEKGKETEPEIEYVDSPVPVHTTDGRKALAETTGTDKVNELATRSPGRQQRAPSGRLVRLADLLRFITEGAAIGPTFDEWARAPRRWKHEYWRDVVATLALYGVVNEPKERITTRFVVTKDEGLALLAVNLDRPTPQESVVPLVLEGRVTDRTETEQETGQQRGGVDELPPHFVPVEEAAT